jgi:hypothetical protein
MTTKLYKKCGINIVAVSVGFCSDEQRYNTPDSHYIQIPEQLFNNFMHRADIEKPLFVGVCNSQNPHMCLYFGKVEPTIRTENSSSDMCLLPEWAMNRLQLDSYGDRVDIEIMNEEYHIKKLGYIKMRANISSYTKWENIKDIIEIKLGDCNCVNNGDEFYINDVIFTIVELKDHSGNIIECGSTFRTETNLDFEIPDDLRELERKRSEEEFKRAEEKIKLASLPKAPQKDHKHSGVSFGSRVVTLKDTHEEIKESQYFTGQGNKLSTDTTNRIPTREERVAMILKRLKEEKTS